MTRDTYLKQKQWEPVEIVHHEWMILRILTVSFLAIKSAIVKFCDLRTSLTTGTCDQNIFDDSFPGIWKYFNRICWKQRLIVGKVGVMIPIRCLTSFSPSRLVFWRKITTYWCFNRTWVLFVQEERKKR